MAITRDSGSVSDSLEKSTSRAVNKKLDLLDKKMGALYKDVYISRPDNKDNLQDIIDNMDNVIDRLHGNDITVSGMTELLKRVDNENNANTKKFLTSVEDLFSDSTFINSLMLNNDVHKYIAAQNYNFDLICKYLPKLQDALEIKRDNVLCSDNFSKQFLNAKSAKSSKEEVEKFSNNTNRLEREYELSDFLEKTYMNTSKYGEDFIYIVPYRTAFTRLFNKQNRRLSSAHPGMVSFFENCTDVTILKESWESTKEFKTYSMDALTEKEFSSMPEMPNITLHFNRSNMITNSVNEYCILNDNVDVDIFKSLAESYDESFGQSVSEALDTISEKNTLDTMFDKLDKANNKLKYHSTYTQDGLILPNQERDPKNLDKDFLGAVVERLPRENVIPLYIGKKCLGYYYFEYPDDPGKCGFCGGHHAMPLSAAGNQNLAYNMTEQQQEIAMRYLASRISQAIDTKFINANKDLKEEIYAVLNYNSKFDITKTSDIGITFIPAEDIVHTYFEINEYTHRGISDLQRSVMPALLYILLYLSDIIGKITRSVDKRVYYVKQNIETNVARTMMNVVGQIKKGNMGVRQIESMNNILNIVGKYNDYIIPLGPSGDPPVQMEVMQGQNIETPTDIMDKMEEMAINPIMPFEFVNATMQQDFATRFTMSNTRFLKSIFTRQRKTEKFFSKIFTKIYNYEYGENNPEIKITLPPPIYLTLTNNSQLIDNVTQMADKIAENEMSTEEDDVKQEFKKLYIRENLATYMDYAMIAKLLEKAKVNVETAKVPQATESDDNNMDDLANDNGF